MVTNVTVFKFVNIFKPRLISPQKLLAYVGPRYTNYRICSHNLRTFFLFWPLKNWGA